MIQIKKTLAVLPDTTFKYLLPQAKNESSGVNDPGKVTGFYSGRRLLLNFKYHAVRVKLCNPVIATMLIFVGRTRLLLNEEITMPRRPGFLSRQPGE